MIITDIQYGENKKYKIYLNDECVFELYKSEIKAENLQVGMEVDAVLYDKILYQVVGKRAVKRAMHILEKRDKTRKQLEDKLRENHYPKECIAFAVEYVESYGYIDDYSYASRYVEFRKHKKSRSQLQQELLGKGIDRAVVSQVLEEIEYREEDILREQILKKCPNPWELSKEQKRKLMASFMRKGFSYGVIERSLSDIIHGS